MQHSMPEYRSILQSTSVDGKNVLKVHRKVVAKTALVLKDVDKCFFLVLLQPFSGWTAVKSSRLRWTAVGP